MRAGAGKLQIASVSSRAAALAVAMPEALIIDVPETQAGGLLASSIALRVTSWTKTQALLVGPGMVEEPDCYEILKCLLSSDTHAVIIVDAGALSNITKLR
jgi:NAD(P)H-hydrate repair Nnr-like enzyme with NAD(P)H-hydrate dehydratase domain